MANRLKQSRIALAMGIILSHLLLSTAFVAPRALPPSRRAGGALQAAADHAGTPTARSKSRSKDLQRHTRKRSWREADDALRNRELRGPTLCLMYHAREEEQEILLRLLDWCENVCEYPITVATTTFQIGNETSEESVSSADDGQDLFQTTPPEADEYFLELWLEGKPGILSLASRRATRPMLLDGSFLDHVIERINDFLHPDREFEIDPQSDLLLSLKDRF